MHRVQPHLVRLLHGVGEDGHDAHHRRGHEAEERARRVGGWHLHRDILL